MLSRKLMNFNLGGTAGIILSSLFLRTRVFLCFKKLEEEMNMLDMRRLRNHFQEIREKLEHRGEDLSELDHFGELDEVRRELIAKGESLKAIRNETSKQISVLKREKKDADTVIKEMREVSDQITAYDGELHTMEEKLNHILLSIPNIPHETVPIGEDEEDNVEVRQHGSQTAFSFAPKAHWDVATHLDVLDFERAAKVTGSRFVFYKGLGARLERALLNFMMDLHADEHDYTEMLPPYIVNRQSMTGTGQLPKFEEDAFRIEELDYFLVPTAEVPVTNYHRDEILELKELPIRSEEHTSELQSRGHL